MPYVHLNTSRPLNADELAAVRDLVAEHMPLLPGKTRENTMIHVSGGCAISKGDPAIPALFIEVRTYKASPDDAKKEFSAKLIAALSEKLNVPGDHIYMNIIALDEWYKG